MFGWAENRHPRRKTDRVSPVLAQARELSCEVVGIGLIAKEEYRRLKNRWLGMWKADIDPDEW